MRIITCIICEQSVARSDMINHIAEDLNYFRYQCNFCTFKTAYSHAIVEHELDTGHDPAKENINRYLDRLCSIVYKDCVLREKKGIDAVFEPNFQSSATVLSSREGYITPSMSSENLRLSAVSKSSTLLASELNRLSSAITSGNADVGAAESDDEPAIVGEKNKSDQVNTVYDVEDSDDIEENNGLTVPNASETAAANEITTNSADNFENTHGSRKQKCKQKSQPKTPRKQAQGKRGTTLEQKKSKLTEVDATAYESLIRANCVDMTMENTLRDTVKPIQTCLKCSVDVPNDYRSHKEHVQKMHSDECSAPMVEDRSSLISKCILRCFPNAIASNDYQCTMCSHEVRSSSGRRHHVDRNHLYMYFTCPSRECSATFSQMESLMQHLKALHEASDSLTGEERLILKHTKDTHNSKLREMVARSFPYPVPSSGISDQILTKSALIAVDPETDAGDTETDPPPPVNVESSATSAPTASVPEAAKDGSASYHVEYDSPASRDKSTVLKTSVNGSNLRIYKKEVDIKEEENDENEKKSRKRKKFDDSSSSSESDEAARAQRTLKISRIVDEINLREAQRRRREGVFCFNRQLPVHRRPALPSNYDSSSSLSSTSTDCDGPVYSVPRRVPTSALKEPTKVGTVAKGPTKPSGAVIEPSKSTVKEPPKVKAKAPSRNGVNNQKNRASTNSKKSSDNLARHRSQSRTREMNKSNDNSDRGYHERNPSSSKRGGRSVSGERSCALEERGHQNQKRPSNYRARHLSLSRNSNFMPMNSLMNGLNNFEQLSPAIPGNFAAFNLPNKLHSPDGIRARHPLLHTPVTRPTAGKKAKATNTGTLLKPVKLERP